MCHKRLTNLLFKNSPKTTSFQSLYFYSNLHSVQNLSSPGLPSLHHHPCFMGNFHYPSKFTVHRANCNSLRLLLANSSSLSGLNVQRSYCSNKQPELPKLTDLPPIVWPSIFKTIRNWILSNLIIMRYFDPEFNLDDFIIGSKQAMETVSGLISKGDLDSLSGLVAPEVIAHLRGKLDTFSLKQRQEFAIKADDVYFSFPYEVGVMFPDEGSGNKESQTRFVEITMCYHALQGLKELRRTNQLQPSDSVQVLPEFQDKIFICNYRFIREFTKGVNDEWTINAVNHFKPPMVV